MEDWSTKKRGGKGEGEKKGSLEGENDRLFKKRPAKQRA